MSSSTRLIASGIAAVVLYDLFASSFSRLTGFAYGYFGIGSIAICLAIGFFASRCHSERPAMLAILAGSMAGFADATLGWWISVLIGPGRPRHTITVGIWLVTLLMVMLSDAFLSAIGYFVESRWLYKWNRSEN